MVTETSEIMRLSPASSEPALPGNEVGRASGDTGWPMPLRLLIALLGTEPGPLPALSPEQWDEFAALVIERHRVAPAIAAALAASGLTPPDPVRARIEAEARANGFAALRQKAETGRLIFGDGEYWPYGIAPNRATLEAFLRFCFEQGVCHRLLAPEDIFPEQVQSFFKE